MLTSVKQYAPRARAGAALRLPEIISGFSRLERNIDELESELNELSRAARALASATDHRVASRY
jgi:hypothetical protein